jgi:hypothetical protein
MAKTTFSGPVVSKNGFDTEGAPLKLATPVGLGTDTLAVDSYITILGQDGNVYYIPVSSAPPAP